jgi:prepilin-type N-terminal cleavage/methylation domain-containing protein
MCKVLGFGGKNMNTRKAAFTLVELLVVISIIAVLLAVLMPSLNKAREQGKSVVCGSRQKDIGLALSLYAADWSQKLPTATLEGDDYTRLPYKLKPYHQRKGTKSNDLFGYELYRCSTQKLNPKAAAVGSFGYNSFYFNGLQASNGKSVERSVLDMKNAAVLPLLACLSQEIYQGFDSSHIGGQEMAVTAPHPSVFKYGYMGGKLTPLTRSYVNNFGPAPNHNRKCDFLMGDFHVEAVNICVDGKYPWTDHKGTVFHPSGKTSKSEK